MSCKQLSKHSGLSLLEAVAGIAIVLLLSALAFPQIGRYWQTYQLDSAVQTLSSNLEVARYTAIAKRVNVVAQFLQSAATYDVFEDGNGNGTRDGGELLLGSYSLPKQVQFNGAGLLGPPSSPSGPVGDPITFGGDKVTFNPEGRINGGTGTLYLQNSAKDASALSYNIASRMKIYRWNKTAQTWK